MKCGCSRRAWSSLHFLADRRDRVGVHAFRGQLTFGNEAFNRTNIDRVIYFAEQPAFGLGCIAVADRVNQQIAECLTLE